MIKAIFKESCCKDFAICEFIVIKNMNYDNIFSLDSSLQSNNTNIKSVVKK